MALQPNQAESASDRRRSHLKEVTSDPPPDSLGAVLRNARLKLGEDLRAAAKVTKIKTEYLEALEEERISDLPGRTYAIGFLRTYAGYLGLDANACVTRLKNELLEKEPSNVNLSLAVPEIEEEVRVPQGVLIVAGILVLGLIYGGIYLFRAAGDYMDQRAHPTEDTTADDMTTPLPQASSVPLVADKPVAEAGSLAPPSVQLVPGPIPAPPAGPVKPTAGSPGPAVTQTTTAPAKTDAASAIAKPPQSATVVPARAPAHDAEEAPTPSTTAATSGPLALSGADGTAGPAPSLPDSVQKPAPADYEQAIASAPRTYGTSSSGSRVVLKAKEPVFVRIETEGPRSQVLFEGMLGKGEVYFVPPGAKPTLVARDGGSLGVFVDGTDKGSAGPSGIALKGLSLDADTLETH